MNYALSNTSDLPEAIILDAERFLRNMLLIAHQRNYLNDIIHVTEQWANNSGLALQNENKQKRILVVEDMLLIQDSYKECLLKLDYCVGIANNMSQTFAKVDNNYDLLILDIGLPDGIEIDVAKTFIAHPKYQNIFMIAVTTFSSDEMKAACFAAGMNEFYTKPVPSRKPAEIVKNIFEAEISC